MNSETGGWVRSGFRRILYSIEESWVLVGELRSGKKVDSILYGFTKEQTLDELT